MATSTPDELWFYPTPSKSGELWGPTEPTDHGRGRPEQSRALAAAHYDTAATAGPSGDERFDKGGDEWGAVGGRAEPHPRTADRGPNDPQSGYESEYDSDARDLPRWAKTINALGHKEPRDGNEYLRLQFITEYENACKNTGVPERFWGRLIRPLLSDSSRRVVQAFPDEVKNNARI